MANCMLHPRSLPSKLLAEALNYANYIQNMSPQKFVKDRTPFEAWSGIKLEVTHFLIFGSRAWARVPFEKKKALDPQSTPCIFVGYLEGLKGYRLIDPSTNNLVIEQSVQFEESLMHASQESHAKTSTPLVSDIRDDVSTHSDQILNLISELDSKDLEHADDEPPQMPK
jgi:hypothetical protein